MPGLLPEKITIREKYAPAMEIEDQAEADAYFQACVEHALRTGAKTRAEGERVERLNLGYFAGYYSQETRMRVQRLYGAVHPYLGDAGTPDAPIEPTVDQCFAAGRELAETGSAPKD